MKKVQSLICCLLAMTLFLSCGSSRNSGLDSPLWSVRMAESEMIRNPSLWMADFVTEKKWNYTQGLMGLAFLKLYDVTDDKRYFNYAKGYADSLIDADGIIYKYRMDNFIQNATLAQFAVRTIDVPVKSVFSFNENGATNMSLEAAKIPTVEQARSTIFSANAGSTFVRPFQTAAVSTGILPRSSIFTLHETSADRKDLVYSQALLNDVAAPVISEFAPETIAAGVVRINWTTNEFASGQVRYGATQGDYDLELGDDLYQLNHSLVLQGLAEGTKYFFIVRSVDRSGNEAISEEMDFVA